MTNDIGHTVPSGFCVALANLVRASCSATIPAKRYITAEQTSEVRKEEAEDNYREIRFLPISNNPTLMEEEDTAMMGFTPLLWVTHPPKA